MKLLTESILSMKQVVVEVLGGVVQDVYADEGIRVVVVDWDNLEEGEECCAGVYPPCGLDMMPEETEEQVRKAE